MGRVEDRIETLEQKQKWISILHSSLIIALILMYSSDSFDGVVELAMLLIAVGMGVAALWAAFRLYAIDTGSSQYETREGDTNLPTAEGLTDD